MKQIQCWSFLVSRNKYFDYETLVAPNFICKANIAYLIKNSISEDLTPEGFACYREIHGAEVGDLTLVFRVIEATSIKTGIPGNKILKDHHTGENISYADGSLLKDSSAREIKVTNKNEGIILTDSSGIEIQLTENSILTDSSGRDISLAEELVLKDNQCQRNIQLIEGIVIKGVGLNISITQEDLDRVHSQLIEKYQYFWKKEQRSPAIPSDSFSLKNEGTTLKLNILQPKILNNTIEENPERQENSPVDSQSEPFSFTRIGKCIKDTIVDKFKS